MGHDLGVCSDCMEWHTYRARWQWHCIVVCDITCRLWRFLRGAIWLCIPLLGATATIQAMMYVVCVNCLDVYWIRFEHFPRRAQAMQRFDIRFWLCMNFFMLISYATCYTNLLPTSSISLESGASLQQELAGYCTKHLVEMAQCRQRLSEIHMRCKVGTRQHDFLNAHTHVHTITALNYKLMHSHLYVAVHSLVYIAVHFPNDLLLIRIQHTQGFSLQQTRNLDLPAVLLRLDAGHTRTIWPVTASCTCTKISSINCSMTWTWPNKVKAWPWSWQGQAGRKP